MASFAKHIPLLLLLIALLSNVSAGSYGEDDYGVSKQEEGEPSFFPNTGDNYGLGNNPSTLASSDDADLRKSMEAYERGIKYAKLMMMNGMNNYGVKAVDNNDDDDGDDDDLMKSLDAYGQGIKYAKLVKSQMNNYDVKAINNNNDDDDDDDDYLKSLDAYGQGIENAKLVKNQMNNYGVKAVDINNNDNVDDEDDLKKSLDAYGQGIEYAKLVKNRMNNYGVKTIDDDDLPWSWKRVY